MQCCPISTWNSFDLTVRRLYRKCIQSRVNRGSSSTAGHRSVSDDNRNVGGENTDLLCWSCRDGKVGSFRFQIDFKLIVYPYICLWFLVHFLCKFSTSYPICILFHCFFRSDAEMEYLKIVHDLEMYGVNYFHIKVKSFFKNLLKGFVLHITVLWSVHRK